MTHQSRRDVPGFHNVLSLERAPLDGPEPVAGLPGALMSHDPRSGARSSIVELPPGWRGRSDGRGASFELFLLSGDMALDGARVGDSGYIHLPQGCGGGELVTVTGALALAFWNPNLPAFPYPCTRNRTLRAWELPWVDSVPGSHGVRHKSLRLPDPTPQPGQEGVDGGPGRALWGDGDPGTEVPFLPGARETASRFRASWTRKDDA